MTRRCRYCRTEKSEDQFVGTNLCRECGTRGHGRRAVGVTLNGWHMGEPRLPEMTIPTADELAAGYGGERWMATKGDWKIEVVWRGDHAKYLCRTSRISDPENPMEARTFTYPHEVVDWIGVWGAQLARAR